MVEVFDEAVGDLRYIELTFVCTATLTCAPLGMPRQPRQAIEGLADRIRPEMATLSDPCCWACATIWSMRVRSSK